MRRAHLEVEATVHTGKRGHGTANLIGGAAAQLCHSHGRHTVVDVDGDGLAEVDTRDIAHRRDEVEGNLPVVYTNVFSMEIAFVLAIGVHRHPFAHGWLKVHTAVDDQRATFADERGVVAETLTVGLFGAIDVEVVGIDGCDDSNPWTEPVERTVVLIGFQHHIVAVGE